jgi:hypothetical protein
MNLNSERRAQSRSGSSAFPETGQSRIECLAGTGVTSRWNAMSSQASTLYYAQCQFMRINAAAGRLNRCSTFGYGLGAVQISSPLPQACRGEEHDLRNSRRPCRKACSIGSSKPTAGTNRKQSGGDGLEPATSDDVTLRKNSLWFQWPMSEINRLARPGRH